VLYINANFKVGDVKKKSVSIENGDGSKEITLVLGTDEEAAQWQKVFATVIEKFSMFCYLILVARSMSLPDATYAHRR
jgi:hypothetical protein